MHQRRLLLWIAARSALWSYWRDYWSRYPKLVRPLWLSYPARLHIEL